MSLHACYGATAKGPCIILGTTEIFNTFPFKISNSVTEVKNKPQNPLARIEKSQQSIAIEQQKPMAIYGEIMEIKGSIC